MAKREIRISLFYSDLFVFDFMRQKNRLDQFLKSSNDFYGKYKLRLDPFPFSYNYTLYKDAFVLSAGRGIKPDMNQDQLAADMRADSATSAALRKERADPNTSPARVDEIDKALEKLRNNSDARIWQGFNSNGEYDFRKALGERFETSKTLKAHERDFKKAPRLVVVFCEFIALAARSQTNTDTGGVFVHGLDRQKATAYKQHKKPIPKFTPPFIIIDIPSASWHTLAHEIAHGNGHSHPEGEFGGYYDGPQESIYNYFSSSLPPSQVILEDADLKTLELAFFVRE